MLNPLDLWRRWLESLPLLALSAFVPPPPSGAGPSPADPFDMAARWREWLAASATPAKMPGATAGATSGAMPGDSWIAFRQWYEHNSAAMSGPLEGWLRSDAFAQMAGAFWESAATATRAARRASEAQLATLGIASRADVARMAGLVIQVEAKVDHIEEALEDAKDAEAVRTIAASKARADGLTMLERRVERIEAKLDRLLAAFEAPERREMSAPTTPPEMSAPTTPPEISAPASPANGAGKPAARPHKPSTTRTRRKPPNSA